MKKKRDFTKIDYEVRSGIEDSNFSFKKTSEYNGIRKERENSS